MNILVLGSGGREHALSWKLAQSPKLSRLFIAPGNAGTSGLGQNVNINVTDFDAIRSFVLEKDINMVVVGPEDPLVNGIHDYFLANESLRRIPVIGPQKDGARLEGSKEFSKQFMHRHGIPTADYASFTTGNIDDGYTFLETLSPPYVLKADGLAAGKGVLIIDNIVEAKVELNAMLMEAKFGDASAKVVIEEFLSGIELSVFVLTDGRSYKVLPSAKDYKRIGEGDMGLNTGGMGAISPVPFADEVFLGKVEERIIKPTIEGLRKENIDYRGFIFIGLMNVEGNPMVIEYNVRMGDPESEVVIPRLRSDLLDLFEAVGDGSLASRTVEFDERAAATIMLVSGGYPGSYPKRMAMSGFDQVEGSILFHAGTCEENGQVLTNGGRVIAITSLGDDLGEALATSYRNADIVDFEGKYYRKDIGFDLKPEPVG